MDGGERSQIEEVALLRTERSVAMPILIAGERHEPGENALAISYDDRLEVLLKRPTPADAKRMIEADRAIGDLSVDDITIFFDRVRQNWLDPDNRWRQMAIDLGSLATGYAAPIMRSDVDYLGHTLERLKQYDFIETDLDDPALLDEWRPTKAVYRRCLPKGLVAHVMVGNVPLASLFSLYRSLVTKNVTVAKVPSRDVMSALCFANCIHDTSPTHPVTRALSVAYWDAGSAVEDLVLQAADVVCVWGRGSTVDAVRRRLPQGTDLLEFGPKRSFAVVLDGTADEERCDDIALRVAYDTVFYDQEACFSAQEAYVAGDTRGFASRVRCWLALAERLLPRRPFTVDAHAHVQRARLEAEAEGWEVIAPEGTEWTVVVTDGPTPVPDHPLGRFLFVHPIDGIEDVMPYVDRNVQTVSLAPWESCQEVAGRLVAAGADRVVQVGRMTRFRPGLTHDGMQPMRHMVRWVTLEREIGYKFRFTSVDPADYDEMLYGPIRRLAAEVE